MKVRTSGHSNSLTEYDVYKERQKNGKFKPQKVTCTFSEHGKSTKIIGQVQKPQIEKTRFVGAQKSYAVNKGKERKTFKSGY